MTAPSENKCVYIIFNPVSGKTDPEERKKAISDALAEHGYTCQFSATTEEIGARELTKKALEEGVDLVAVSGGDGTVMETLAALIGTDTPVAVFPAGTGNLLSINLGIPMTVPEAVEVALSGKPYKLDLARSGDDRHFAIMGGIGFDAQVIADADREAKRRFGVFAYFWAAFKNLARRRELAEITLDDHPPFRRRVKTVMVANMGRMTGGIEAVPTASSNDGQLDMVVVRTETLGQWARLLGYALIGRTQQDPAFDVYQAKRMRVRTARPQPLELDGEEAGKTREWKIEIVPQAVCVLVPETAPAVTDAEEVPPIVVQVRRKWPVLAAGAVLLTVGIGLYLWKQKNRESGS